MSNKRDRVKEERDYQELISVVDVVDVKQQKQAISKLVPSEIKVIAKNESQKKLINSIKNNEITICAGPAGTGKTFVSVAFALNLLRKDTNRFKKIYLVKSVTALKGEELGFLKGDMMEKIEPFMWSFMINMEKVIPEGSIKMMVEKGILKPFPLAYMRGASLDDCIIIADEMQNVTLDNARTLMTRIGSNSKIILLGDINQVDLKNKEESSLEVLLKMFKDSDNIGVIEMSEEDTNVRNPIITMIETKYKEYKAISGSSSTYKNKKQLLTEDERK